VAQARRWQNPAFDLKKQSRRTFAFTLIELLVVIAIIAILASMLLPTLSRAKETGYKARCISNEKQIVLAWTLYANENRDLLVLNGGDPADVSTAPHLWVYGGNHGDPLTLTNTDYLVRDRYALFSPYIKNYPIYKCPADRSVWQVPTAKDSRYVNELRSYSLNSYMSSSGSSIMTPLSLSSAYQKYFRFTQLAAGGPANRFTFMDVNPYSICTPAFGVDMTGQTFIHYPSALHNGSGVITFADGHAEQHKWRDKRTLRPTRPGETYITHGEASPANQDLVWITNRTTSKF
jgi:prepilin-type N-terminal cleavage/methylation domain-containing protein/prepilin-type processing-associated H-X9-DG protein